VDKFQGQEAPVVFFSIATSSGEDVPRNLEFLLSRNRLNVAVSRAKCLAYVVASPKLLEVGCRSIEQMRMANALCLFVEIAEASGSRRCHPKQTLKRATSKSATNLKPVKRLQIMIDGELDAALARKAAEEGVSKAALVRRYVGERLRQLPPLEDDPLWEIIGMNKGSPGDSMSVNDVVYGPKRSR
jgi:AAA domain/Ribbon-helix-helix protein, copG family